jgi:chromosomal replication initiation ATPase DnaA
MISPANLAATILATVADITDIPIAIITSQSRTAETVDARHLAVAIMQRVGIHTSRIAAIMNISTRSVQRITTDFHTRTQQRPLLRHNFDFITAQVRQGSDISNC